MPDIYLSSQKGHRINPAVDTDRMVAASGQKLTCTVADTDYTLTVVAEARYVITADATGVIYLGIDDITADANIIWCVGPAGSIGIEIPIGTTTLHYGSDCAGTIGRLARLDDTK